MVNPLDDNAMRLLKSELTRRGIMCHVEGSVTAGARVKRVDVERALKILRESKELRGKVSLLQNDGTFATFDAVGTPMEKLRELAVPNGPVSSLRFSPDGRTLVAQFVHLEPTVGRGYYTRFRAWKLPDFRPHYDLDPKDVVGAFAFSAESKLLLIGTGPSGGSFMSAIGELQFWDLNTGKMREKPYHVNSGINSLACSPDGKTIALGSAGGEVSLFDYDALLHGRTKRGDFGCVVPENRLEEDGGGRTMEQLAFSIDSRSLAALAWSKRLTIWDTSANRVRYKVKEWVTYFVMSPKNDVLAIGIQPHTDGPVTYKILRVEDGVQIGELAAPHNAQSAFSNDGKLLATGSPGGVEYVQGEGGREIAGVVKIWNAKTLRHVQTLDSSAIGPVAFSPKEGLLATATTAGSVAIWRVSVGK
jgi:WD40 repeat protein